MNFRTARRRLGDPTQNFEQRALTGSISPDHSHDLATLDIERYVLKCPDHGFTVILVVPALCDEGTNMTKRRGNRFGNRLAKRLVSSAALDRADVILLSQISYVDGDLTHDLRSPEPSITPHPQTCFPCGGNRMLLRYAATTRHR